MMKKGLEIKFLKIRLELKLQFKIIVQICFDFIVELLFYFTMETQTMR